MAATAELSIIIRAVDLASAELEKVKKSTAGLRQVGSTLQAFGMQMTLLGAAVGAPLVGAIKSFASMEEQLKNVNAVLGGTGESFKELEAIVIDVGKRSSFSLSQVGEAMYNMASAGMSLEQLKYMTEPVTTLAEAIHADLGPSTQLLTDTLQQFSIDAKDAGHVVDVFAQAVRKSPENMQRLAEGLKYAGPPMAALGKSIEDTVAALMVFEKAGLHGQMAGTSLRQIIVELQTPTQAFQDRLTSLGLTMEDINPKTHSLAEIIETLQSRGFQASEAMKYFGARAGTAFSVLLNVGPQALIETRKELENVQGVAESMKLEQLDSIAGKFRMLKSSVETMLAAFGGTKANAVGKFLDKLRAIADWFTNLDDKTKNLIMSIAGWTSGIFLGAGALALLIGTTMKMIATFKEFGAAMKGLFSSSSLLVEAFAGIKKAILSIPWSSFGAGIKNLGTLIVSFVTTAGAMIKTFVVSAAAQLKTLFVLFATNPIALAVTGIVAALTLLILNWDKVAPAIKAGIDAIIGFFKTLYEWLKTVFIPIWETLKAVWNGISNAFVNTWTGIFDFFKRAVNGIVKFFATITTPFRKVLSGIKEYFKEVWNGIVAFFKTLWNSTIGFFGNIISQIIGNFQTISEPFSKVINFIGNLFEKTFGGILDVITIVTGWFIDSWRAVANTLSKIFSSILAIFQAIWEAIVKIAGPVVNFLMSAWNKFAGFWKNLWSGLWKIVSWIFDGIIGMMNLFIKGLNGVLWVLDKLGIVKEGFRIPEIHKITEVNVNINVDARKSVDTEEVLNEINKAARKALVMEAGLNG